MSPKRERHIVDRDVAAQVGDGACRCFCVSAPSSTTPRRMYEAPACAITLLMKPIMMTGKDQDREVAVERREIAEGHRRR